MDIGGWLRELGLERYEQAFRENEIDLRVLPELTADDLKELGVAAIGHRRLLLKAIADLAVGAGRAAAKDVPAASPANATAEAERRQLTVMFCDLVGSTPLSSRFDPEDLREILGAYHRCAADTVACFAGFVAKYMGDGVLVYFGYPEAHEDDAERAVRAGLAVIDAVGRLNTAEPLNVRLGIASGLVVVGDLIGAGAAQERGVVGETPNLAARLQALAQPGALVIADSTRRQIGALFELDDLGLLALAGFALPHHAWRVVGESGVVSRFEALRSQAAPLVGRGEELELLLRRWQQAKAGEGRVVLISGEPGIGKSRLTAALSERIRSEPHTRLRYFCSPHHQDSALHPFITQLERAAGFARDDPVEQKLGKLRELLASGARSDDEIELLAELLSLPSTAAGLNLSPQRKREMLFEALLHQLEALARTRPVVMIFEDAHWIDPTTRELLDLTIDRASRQPILLIVTFRAEFQQAWGGQPHVTMLALNRLGERDVATLVRGLAGNAPLGSEIVEEIVERTDGVPLFIEELTRAVLERADQDNRVAAVLSASPLPALAVPSTLHASLLARLDRIGAAAKEVAQIGAVLGREFSYELIQPVTQRSDGELQAALARLTEAGLLFCRGVAPLSSYLFKHALVQDAAYGTLLRARRQELHARVGAVLEAHFADLVERQPELLAYHLTAAGDAEHAIRQWFKAGQHATARSTHYEAIAHLERGIGLLGSLPEASIRNALELELQLALGLCLYPVKGPSSREVGQAYARACELAERQSAILPLFQAVYGLWQTHSMSGRIPSARPFSERLLHLTSHEVDTGLRLQAHHSAWTTAQLSGQLANADKHAEAGRRLYDIEQHRSHRHLYGGHDPGVCARWAGANLQWLLGYPEKALTLGREALDLAERIAHPFSLSLAYGFVAVLHLSRREPEPALRLLERQEAVAAEQRLVVAVQPGILRGHALAMQGATDEAVSCLREALAALARRGATVYRPYGLAYLAETLALRGEYAPALAALREGFETVDTTGERWWEAELHRVNGIALCGLNKLEEGQAVFEDALRTARQQQAKSLELRAATSLARLWGEQGRRAEARELLAPVYAWFTEGFDTADLKDAANLLSELL
jgi:class 3 adenylate cyclase/predicted ATPase